VKKMKEAGYVLGNLDCTIIAQKPKLSPHKVRRAADWQVLHRVLPGGLFGAGRCLPSLRLLY
jgi:hypothetical protein